MAKVTLNQLLVRVLLFVYVLRLVPVTKLVLQGQVALRSALASRAAPQVALGSPRSAATAALDAAAQTAVDLAGAAQQPALVEIVVQDEDGPALLVITPEHAAIVSVRMPLLRRVTAFNVSSSRWQLEDVEIEPDEEEAAEGSTASEQPARAEPVPDSAVASSAEVVAAGEASAASAAAAVVAAEATAAAAEAEAPPPAPQYLDAILRFRNARTRKSHLVLCSTADAVRVRALHRRALVRRQLAQIDRDARRSSLPAHGTRVAVLREALIAYALQPPLAERYCQGNNLLAAAIVRAFFHGDAQAEAEAALAEGEAGEPSAAAGQSAFPHLSAPNLALLREEFVRAGLFPPPAATQRALARLRREPDEGRALRAWAATHVLGALQFVMVTQGLAALSLSEGGRADELKGQAVRGALAELLGGARGELRAIRAEAEALAVGKGGEAEGEGAGGAGAQRAEAEGAEAAAAPPAPQPQPQPQPVPDSVRAEEAQAQEGEPAAPAPPGFDLLDAMLSAFDPTALASTLCIPPSAAQLRAPGAGGEAAAEEQAHFLALWRLVLRAGSAGEAQSGLLKAVGARLLGYCHQVRGRRWNDPWDESLLQRAGVFEGDWSETLRAHLAAGAASGRARRAGPRPLAVEADRLEWLATKFQSGWRSSELERALLRTRLPAKLGRSTVQARGGE